MKVPRIIVGVSGGSGIPYAIDLLKTIRNYDIETHLVVTAGAKHVIFEETQESIEELYSYASVVHRPNDLGASIASGSFLTTGMVVVPCSAGTLAKIATGFTDNLLARAAHVVLKERRRLVLVVREAPYSRAMIENMLRVHDAGAVILPASPGFYHRPQSIQDLLGTVSHRVLDHFGIFTDRSRRWREEA